MVNLKINNIPVTVENGTTILAAARQAGIKIPTLCFLKDVNEIGACRICVVEVKGARNLVASCVYPVNEGMEVFTNTERVIKARKTTLELILSNHRKECLSCDRNTNCELQKLAYEYGCDTRRYYGAVCTDPMDTSSPYLVRDNTKCILCRRCVAMCNKVQGIGALGASERGFNTTVGSAFDLRLINTPCIGCGQCVIVCPTGALTEKDELANVKEALNDPSKYVIVGSAPSVRAGLGEEFGYPVGTNVEGQMVTALRMMGFKKVFDVNCSADFTIMEEATELLTRITSGGSLPMFTSCCPGWVNYMERNYPDLLDHLSTCKSPQNMFGALMKHIYAKREGIDPKNVYVVSVMPCTGKKGEKLRTATEDLVDVDAVLTTRQLARLIKNYGIDFRNLENGALDNPFGEYTGAALLFGATGGVMEAALRTAAEKLGAKDAPIDFVEVRGLDGVKEATYNVNGVDVKVAVVNGITNAKIILDKVRAGTADYHFVEVMTCPGGCVNGGGQPINGDYNNDRANIIKLRTSVLYGGDKAMKVRKSHDNKSVLAIYAEHLGEPNSHLAHKLLHTHYTARPKYTKE
ncbi:MAG: iron hydrogenase small subunit [Clostridia bacterium]|nr:iron hydrogenase small subunit [Clostridia bacterium]MBQ8873229.1 iron hydrogenase small subunit [Clostridia bacterium]MBQ9707318.1 iron hydrogenase small subunit [Clostridia bacterium]